VIVSSSSSLELVSYADSILQQVICFSPPHKLHNFLVRVLDDLVTLILDTVGAGGPVSLSPKSVIGYRKIAILRSLSPLRYLPLLEYLTKAPFSVLLAVTHSSSQFATVAGFCVRQVCVAQTQTVATNARADLPQAALKFLPMKDVVRNEIDQQFISILSALLGQGTKNLPDNNFLLN